MLLRFYIENFKSFNERTEFNMLAGSYKRFPEHITNAKGLKILKNSAIYGSNAAGKTNLILGLETLKDLVTDGIESIKDSLPYYPNKLFKSNLNSDTKFEIDFIEDDVEYSYFISFNEQLISEEYLYRNVSQKGERIFERKTNRKTLKSKILIHKSLSSKNEEKIRLKIYEEELGHNQPFIYLGFNKKLKLISNAYNWFSEKLRFVFIESKFSGLAFHLAKDKPFKNEYNDIIKESGLGIEKVDVKESPIDVFIGNENESVRKEILKNISSTSCVEFGDEDNIFGAYLNEKNEPVVGELVFYHKDEDNELIAFDINEESRGTKRILDLIPTIMNSTKRNLIYIVDEIESSIHPLLIKSLIKHFIKSNRGFKSQIIFTTHESNLLDLDLFRQDEIWFMERNEKNSSNLYSLSDFKVRHDLDVNRGYLEGKFGAIPFLKQFDKTL
ncbi:ATP-binding protein [Tenacibaculum finnmarkense]|uniref:AAA family ATPase n=1 Tax=Tenacibaculum finnmarkense TaxID=2781243 RepID=UPI001EFA9F71|nr:ATP-binding protein [Tenacibaculum finnmarkense]MCG8892930.1 ATP-binding protein [Tenacibaculum finnmarkense]